MSGARQSNRERLAEAHLETVLYRDYGIQSEKLEKRSIGTTSDDLIKPHPSRRSRSSSPPDDFIILKPTSRPKHPSSQNRPEQQQEPRSTLPPRPRVPSKRSDHTPPRSSDSGSPSHSNRKHTKSSSSPHRPDKIQRERPKPSDETDTPFDGRKPPYQQIGQYEPRQKEDPKTKTKHPYSPSHSTNLNDKSSNPDYQKLKKGHDSRPIPAHESAFILLRSEPSPQMYPQRPTTNNINNNKYEKPSSKHDETSRTKPIPTSSSHEDSPHKSYHDGHRQKPYERRRPDPSTLNGEEPLASDRSISIPSPTFNQPDTLPRTHDQKNAGRLNETPLKHAQQRQTPSVRDSPVHKIAIEKFLHQSPDNEVATPFDKINYVEEPNRDFTPNDTERVRNNRTLLLPVLNSARTYVFEKQPIPDNHIRQSHTNGNFYLTVSPSLRSLNTSVQMDN